MPLQIGTILKERYKIEAILGQGGMGAVYRASDGDLGIQVAVKENLFLTDEYARQFQREALVMATLRQPNLPRVGDYFVLPNQGQYLIMDYIEGEDLRERIERIGNLPEIDVVLVGAAICDALSYLHSSQPPIIHRDIKPGNIKIMPDGQVILVDFGLVKVMEDSQQTTTGARAMTPGYSPPEQYGTAHTDGRSDIYSLGATLYAALTGTIPEDGLERVTGRTDLTPIREIQPKVNRRIATVIEKALAVDPDDRYQTGEEFKHALLEAGEASHMAPRTIRVSPPPAPRGDDEPSIEKHPMRTSKPRSRRKKFNLGPLFAALAFILLGMIAGMLYLQPSLPGTLWNVLVAHPTPTLSVVLVPSSTPTLTAAVTSIPSRTPSPTKLSQFTTPATSTPTPTLTATITFTPTITLTPVGGGTAQIAFTSDRNGGIFQVYIMNSTGGDVRQLTNTKDGACNPAWSPDGMRLAFVSPCKAKQEQYKEANIYIMNVDGSQLEVMPQSSVEGDFDPAWSPDGKKIAFTSLRSKTGKPHIFIVDLEQKTLEELSSERFAESQPVWDPSGKNLAVIRQSTNKQIWILPAYGANAYQFSQSGNYDDFLPVWSSDGQFLLYSQSDSPDMAPRMVRRNYEDRANAREFRISSITQPVYKVSLSPDNQWVVFESWPDGINHDIFLINVNGDINSRLRLTKDPGFDFSPTWRPPVIP